MRRFALILATFLVVSGATPVLAGLGRAQALIPTFSVDVIGETNGTRQTFVPERLLIPQVPIHLAVTFHNNETVMQHTFTMNDENGTQQIDTGNVDPGQNVTLSFTVDTMTRITFNGTSFTPEAGPDGILFYCIPHRGTGVVGQGMVGQIILASVQQGGTPEKGILLRAYWIGIIGIAAMLLWVVISYFLIKSSSRHFTDQREHVRKGLP